MSIRVASVLTTTVFRSSRFRQRIAIWKVARFKARKILIVALFRFSIGQKLAKLSPDPSTPFYYRISRISRQFELDL